MTRIDFYLLGRPGDSGAAFACRLVEKAWRLGHRVFVLVADSAAASHFDDLLWTFSQGSFVPHGVYRAADDVEAHPVLIGTGEPPDQCHDVLVSLVPEVPSWFSRFTRVAEIVQGDDDGKRQARERYRFYRERGYALETHQI